MVVAYIGLGSNIDDPAAQIARGLQALRTLPETSLPSHSSLYRSAPWGGIAQPDFINAVARVDTKLPARSLIEELLAIERHLGRRRDTQRYGPRVIDLDLLLYGAEVIDQPGLRVPHPHLHERAFVLLPLAEIAQSLSIPQHGTITAALAAVDTSSCVRI